MHAQTLPQTRNLYMKAPLFFFAVIAFLCASFDRPPNDCLPAAMRKYSELRTAEWKRILSAKRPGKNHVYCVFKLNDQVYVYDSTWGSKPVEAESLDPSSVATAVDPFATHGEYLYPPGANNAPKPNRPARQTQEE